MSCNKVEVMGSPHQSVLANLGKWSRILLLALAMVSLTACGGGGGGGGGGDSTPPDVTDPD